LSASSRKARSDLTTTEEEIVQEFASPIILHLLNSFSSADMTLAINNNMHLGKELEQNPEYLKELQGLILALPFADQIAKKAIRKKWIIWFIDNEMKHKRKDLWNQITYSPKGTSYIIKEVRKIVRLVFA